MVCLWVGLAMWCGIHFFPSLGRGPRAKLIGVMGAGPYKGVFALSIVASIVVIVLGWRAATPVDIYHPPAWGRIAALVLTFAAFVLMAGAQGKSNIRRLLRHPQLTGAVLWAVGHLLANGDNRSVWLFGVIGVWATLEMVLINRRDGAWERPDRQPITGDIVAAAIGAVLFVVLMLAHPYLFGASPIPK